MLGLVFIAGFSAVSFSQYKYSKEYLSRVKKLSPDRLKRFGKIATKHTRKSKILTLRQVMFELNHEFQCVTSGILINNMEMVADCANRASHHRFPKGGLFVYMDLDLISDATIDWLLDVNKAVEVNFDKIEAAAIAGNRVEAASLIGEVMNGCITCHEVAYKDYGFSSHLLEP